MYIHVQSVDYTSGSASPRANDKAELSPRHVDEEEETVHEDEHAKKEDENVEDHLREEEESSESEPIDKENVPPQSIVQTDDEENMSAMVAKVQRQEKKIHKKQKKSALGESTAENSDTECAHTQITFAEGSRARDNNFRAIWVSGFNLSTDDAELEAMFKRCGHVRRVTVIRDIDTWISKGCVMSRGWSYCCGVKMI